MLLTVCLQAAAQATIKELFPLDERSTDLDQTVVSLDKDLVDDFPASDPRWAESRQGERVQLRFTYLKTSRVLNLN